MNKIVILGSSPAGVKSIETIRAQDPSGEITLVTFDGYYPYKRDVFIAYIAKTAKPGDIFCRPVDFYRQNNVRVITDKKISRINVKRKKIFFEGKEQLDYDFLIITDTPENRFSDIKGTGKTGVYGFKKLKDIDQIFNSLPLIDTVAVQSGSFTGLQAACAFQKREKEVILACPQNDLMTKHFDDNVAQWLRGRFEESGIRIIPDNTITEILGERDVKAVRLKPDKVFSAQAVLFCETAEDLRLFTDCGFNLDNQFLVDQRYRTNIENIFSVDQACNRNIEEPVTPDEWLDIQGQAVVSAMRGEDYTIEEPLVTRSLSIDGLSVTLIGQTGQSNNRILHKSFDQESGRYKGLYMEQERLVGAVLVNAEDERDAILRQIKEKTRVETFGEQTPAGEPPASGASGEEKQIKGVSAELVDN